MRLQALLFPKEGICFEEHLYFHNNCEKVRFDSKKTALIFDKKGFSIFDTYFNSFSIGKWKRYTKLEQVCLKLELEGEFCVTLLNKEKINNSVVERTVAVYQIKTAQKQIFQFPYATFDERGMYCFRLDALTDDSKYYGGEYFTDVDEKTLPEVNIAIDMCTFRREKFVYRNMNILNRNILQNKESPLFNHLQVYIADNGSSLDMKKIDTGSQIHVYPQGDVGSAGGFTRGLIEILKDKEKKWITHALMMDDDVLIEPEVLCRNYVLLKMLKEEYQDSFVGGAMLRSDFQYIQHESGGYMHGSDYVILKHGYDLRCCEAVLDNEIEEGASINAWWYCCIPMALITENSLPFPMFFHRDDMEYSLRLCKHLILLNGICVWHEPFENRPGSWQKYYDMRNLPILHALHTQEYGKKQLKSILNYVILRELLFYRYKEADLIMQGIEDFCKGVDWLKNLDAEKHMEEIMAGGYQAVSVEQLSVPFSSLEYEESKICKEHWWTRWKRRLLINGYFLPAKYTAVVSMFNPLICNFYRVKLALNYDPKSRRAYITERNIGKFCFEIKKYLKILRIINKNYNAVKREYRERIGELTSIDFWKKQLGL